MAPLRMELLERIYDDLRGLAGKAAYGRGIEPTSIVHEFAQKYLLKSAYLKKMVNRRYFYGAAFRQMTCLIIDRARKRKAKPLGDDVDRLDELVTRIEEKSGYDIEALHLEMETLKESHARQHEVIQAKIWGGMTNRQIADLLEVSEATVENDYRLARARIERGLSRRER